MNAAHVAQLAAQLVAQEPQLGAAPGPGGPSRGRADDVDLEDGVGQRLGRPVVDLLGQARALGLLCLQDPQALRGVHRRAAGRAHRALLQEAAVGVEAAQRRLQAGHGGLIGHPARQLAELHRRGGEDLHGVPIQVAHGTHAAVRSMR